MSDYSASGALPVELWLRVLGTLRDAVLESFAVDPAAAVRADSESDAIQALKNCALSCRTFRDLAQPLLFETVRLGNHGGRAVKHALQHLYDIDALLAGRLDAANWPKDVLITLVEPSREDSEEHYVPADWRDAMTLIIERILLRMRNIRRISLSYYTLTKSVYDHLCASRQLVELHVNGVNTEESFSKAELQPHQSTIKALKLDGIPFPPWEMVALLPVIRRLAMGPDLESLSVYWTYLPELFHALDDLPEGTFSRLRYLDVGYARVIPTRPLLDVLGRCANLESMKLQAIGYNTGEPLGINLPSELIPRLNTFEGDYPMARTFVEGRPVDDVRLNVEPQRHTPLSVDQDFLETALSRGKNPLRLLELRMQSGAKWTAHSFKAIANLFPRLEELRVVFRITDWWEEPGLLEPYRIEDLGPLPELRNFVFVDLRNQQDFCTGLEESEFEEERNLVLNMAKEWPKLEWTTVRLGAEWDLGDDGEWVVTFASPQQIP